MELVSNENYYQTMYAHLIGPIDMAIQSICKRNTYSELYEVAALSNVLQCKIRSVYPKINFEQYMALWNSVFTPVPTVIANSYIAILWSRAENEGDARAANNGRWIPNHFVPLLLPNMQNEPERLDSSTSINKVRCSLVNRET